MRSTPVYAWTEFCIYKLILFTDENKIILRLTFTCNMILGFTNFSTFLSFGLENLIFRHCETFSFDDGWWVTNSMSECQQKCEKITEKFLSVHTLLRNELIDQKNWKFKLFPPKIRNYFGEETTFSLSRYLKRRFPLKFFCMFFLIIGSIYVHEGRRARWVEKTKNFFPASIDIE